MPHPGAPPFLSPLEDAPVSERESIPQTPPRIKREAMPHQAITAPGPAPVREGRRPRDAAEKGSGVMARAGGGPPPPPPPPLLLLLGPGRAVALALRDSRAGKDEGAGGASWRATRGAAGEGAAAAAVAEVGGGAAAAMAAAATGGSSGSILSTRRAMGLQRKTGQEE